MAVDDGVLLAAVVDAQITPAAKVRNDMGAGQDPTTSTVGVDYKTSSEVVAFLLLVNAWAYQDNGVFDLRSASLQGVTPPD